MRRRVIGPSYSRPLLNRALRYLSVSEGGVNLRPLTENLSRGYSAKILQAGGSREFRPALRIPEVFRVGLADLDLSLDI